MPQIQRPTSRQPTVKSRPAESDLPLLDAPEHVLSTLESDGSRRWLRPRFATGSLVETASHGRLRPDRFLCRAASSCGSTASRRSCWTSWPASSSLPVTRSCRPTLVAGAGHGRRLRHDRVGDGTWPDASGADGDVRKRCTWSFCFGRSIGSSRTRWARAVNRNGK